MFIGSFSGVLVEISRYNCFHPGMDHGGYLPDVKNEKEKRVVTLKEHQNAQVQRRIQNKHFLKKVDPAKPWSYMSQTLTFIFAPILKVSNSFHPEHKEI